MDHTKCLCPESAPAMRLSAVRGLLLALGLLAIAPSQSRAVIIIGDPGRNTSAPTGSLQDSGWQFEGVWQNNFLGTAIAPNYFITASHLGGNVGDKFNFGGTQYTTTDVFNDPANSDLRIWKVSGTFSTYAPIYASSDEVGKSLVVMGMGGPRGPAITVDGAQKGWSFTGQDGQQSWGTNVVTAAGPVVGIPTGQYVTYQFNSALGPNTASLSPGDSGGGVFIQKNGVWQLAAVNFGVDGPYNTHSSSDPNYKAGDAFGGAIFDARGLYFDGDTSVIAPTTGPITAGTSYSTRVSAAAPWITSLIGASVPEPGSIVLLAGGGLLIAVPAWLKARRLQA